MVAPPALAPVTTPVEDPTVAIAVLLLTQWPPVVASESAAVNPTHIVEGPPVITAGGEFNINSIGVVVALTNEYEQV